VILCPEVTVQDLVVKGLAQAVVWVEAKVKVKVKAKVEVEWVDP
jgi:hypothetical protein